MYTPRRPKRLRAKKTSIKIRPDTGRHLWYSGKGKAFGGNVQVVMDHTGFPVYTGPVEPGSTYDSTAARLHVLLALYRSAWLGMPVLADKGYTSSKPPSE